MSDPENPSEQRSSPTAYAVLITAVLCLILGWFTRGLFIDAPNAVSGHGLTPRNAPDIASGSPAAFDASGFSDGIVGANGDVYLFADDGSVWLARDGQATRVREVPRLDPR